MADFYTQKPTAIDIQDVLDSLDALTALTTGAFDQATLHLLKTTVNFAALDKTEMDAAECDFDGYSAATIATWEDSFVNEQGFPEVDGDGQHFECTGSTTPNSVVGFYVKDAGDTRVLFACQFNIVKAMNKADDAMTVIPRYIQDFS